MLVSFPDSSPAYDIFSQQLSHIVNYVTKAWVETLVAYAHSYPEESPVCTACAWAKICFINEMVAHVQYISYRNPQPPAKQCNGYT